MFGIDFPEFVVIAVVALIVLGPERLPKVARFAGLWVRRARAQWASVKDELERELAADELKRGFHDTEHAMRDIGASVRAADAQARREFDALRAATRAQSGADAANAEDDDAARTAVDAGADHDDAPPAAPVALTPTDHRGDLSESAPAGNAPADAPPRADDDHVRRA